MDGECYFLNPLQRDGTSQRQRLVEMLRPASTPIDERGVSDLLIYARDYASYLRFYTPANVATGDWVEFVADDISTLVSEVLHFPHDEIERDFKARREALADAHPPEVPARFAGLFQPILRIAEQCEDWYRGSVEGLALHKLLSRLIASQLSDALRTTAGFALRAERLGVPVAQVNTQSYSSIWALEGISEDETLFPSGALDSEDELRDAVERLAAVFGKFQGSLVLLVREAPSHLEETLERYPEHQPHMALFIAFLRLLQVVRRQLNTLTARHLDFYYREVLGLKRRGEEPDQVHVILELAKNFSSHNVGKDTDLKAGKDAKGTDLFYATDRELVVNKAVLHKDHGLKTVFVDMTDEDNPGIVTNIYAAPMANSADGMGAKIEDEQGKWETFGGTKTPYATIGFAIASPMFLLAEGDRTIMLTFYLKSPAGFDADVVENELRENVKVYASGEKEWLSVTVENVEISDGADEMRQYVRYRLKLGPEAGAATAYNDEVFAEGFDTTHPILKFVLNNEGLEDPHPEPGETISIVDYSDTAARYDKDTLVRFERRIFRAKIEIARAGARPLDNEYWDTVPQSYPYKYFQQMDLDDIEISVAISGVRNLILENDLGVLNPAKPFHPFGPVPRQGSSLLIGSPEIFQKSLESIEMHIEWADLPLENFKDHYAAYTKNDGSAIVSGNRYFTASAAILNAGEWKPLEGMAGSEALFSLREHAAGLTSAAFSPDGKLVVTTSEDNTARLWETGKEEPTAVVLEGHEGSVVSAAFSPDGRRIVTASEDNTARLWEIGKEKPTAIVLEGHEGSVVSATFSPDGKLVATASEDNTAGLWDTENGKITALLEGHKGSVVSAAFSPDGELVVTVSEDNTARLWNAPSGEAVVVLAGHEASVISAAFSPDGKLVVTASDDGTAGLWEVPKGVMIAEFSGHVGSLVGAVFSPDGKRVVTASDDNTARVWDVETYETVSRLIGHGADVTRATFSPDGARIVTASADRTARIWDPESGKLLSILSGHTGRITSAVFSADGKSIVTASSDNTARLWPVVAETVSNLALFDPSGTDDAPRSSRELQFDLTPDDITRDSKLDSFNRFDTSLRQGFMRTTLDKSFLHAMYPRLLAEAAKQDTDPPPPPPLLNPPYTPLMASLSLDYQASEKIGYGSKGKADFADRTERLFQIGPFGQREIYPIADDSDPGGVPIARTLVPEFAVTVTSDGDSETGTAEGTLYIGIDKLEPPQNLALLFQVAEGSEDPEEPVQDVIWSYLAGHGWVDFGTTEIIADGTNGLLTSGVVVFAMPEAMNNTGTILPSGLHWIKASVAEKTRAVPRMIAVHTQAVTASYRNRGNDPDHLAAALAGGTIGKLKSRMAPIKSVTQPYASFGGRMRESDDAFYVRVSERLRHKGRAVTIFDYERLVLEKFPEVYKVRCINHTDRTSEYAAGHVTLVVVPNLRNKNAVDPLKPRLSLNKLDEIREYVAERGSQFITVDVLNPKYEEIKVDFHVRFHQGFDKGHYTTKLNDDIVGFLSPWLHDDAADLTFGGSIHRSSILDFVEKRSYVDFVACFKMDHIEILLEGGVERRVEYPNVEEAKAKTSRSALVSAKQHDIGHKVEDCEDPAGGTDADESGEDSPDASPEVPPDVSPKRSPWVRVPPQPVISRTVRSRTRASGPSDALTSGELERDDRYLGNARTRELHDTAKLTTRCQVDKIPADRRYYFARSEDAEALGYDYCAYCFGRDRSKR